MLKDLVFTKLVKNGIVCFKKFANKVGNTDKLFSLQNKKKIEIAKLAKNAAFVTEYGSNSKI